MITFKLKPEIKARFLEALRSNKYPQGRGCLRDKDSFCVLGVLSDLAVQDGVASWERDYLWRRDYLTVNGWRFSALFPEELLSWACEGSFPNLSGVTAFPLSNSEEAGSLTYANDELEKTFPEIACLVEEYL
jgi:hypothetical protein